MTSRVNIPLDGTTRLFTVPFPFLAPEHVGVRVNAIPMFNPLDWVWVGPTAIEFVRAPSGTLTLFRNTPVDQSLVDFQNGSVLTENDLNTAVRQSLYAAEELRDYYDALIDGSLDKLSNNGTTPGAVLDGVVEEILNSELLADLQQRIEDINLNSETINAQRMRLDAVEDTIDALTDLDGGGIATLVLDETNARVEADNAIVDKIDLIGAVSGDALSFVVNMDTVKVSPTESLANRFAALSASIGANAAAITSEQTARANADSALSTSINLVSAKADTNAANILTEQTARANGDSANATAISTLSTTVNGHTSSISTLQTVSDGLKAQYMVKLDVNGYVSGFGLYNAAGSSQFIVLADKFAVVSPGKTPSVPFVVNGSTIGINGALIVNGTVNADAIAATTLSAITANMGVITAGKMVMTSNTRSLILEGGATYPIWYGVGSTPNETDAYFYAKNNGDLYFRGKLRGSNFDMQSTVIDCGGGRTAPFVIYDCGNSGSSTGGTTLTNTLATLYSPDYGTGYSGTRLAHKRVDVYLYADASGNGAGNTGLYWEVQYDGGSWTTLGTNIFNVSGNASECLAMRYTTRDDTTWNTVRFRATSGGLTHALSCTMQIMNFSPSSNAPGSTTNPDTGESSGGSGGGGMGGGGSWCVTESMFLSETKQAVDVAAEEVYRTYVPKYGIAWNRVVAVGAPQVQPCARIVTTSGAELDVSQDTPFDLRDGSSALALDMLNRHVLVEDDKGNVEWERVVICQSIGLQRVVPISFGGKSFAAGKSPKRRIYSHNMAKPAIPDP
jgi:hypothetical protein